MLVHVDSFSYMSYAVLCREFLLHTLCSFLWGVSLTRSMLVHVDSFSYMSYSVLCREFLLHTLYCFLWGVSLTRSMLFYVGSFSYTPPAVLYWEFLLHANCCFMWGFSLTYPLLLYVGSFSYTLHAVLCGDFLFHASCCSMYGVSLPRLMLFYVRSFSSTPHVVLCTEFLFHASCCSMYGVSLTCSMLFDAGNFSYTPLAVLCAQFLLHALCCFMWAVSLTYPVLFYVGSFSFTPLAGFCGESYSTLIKGAEKESKSLEKRDNGKVCGLQRGTPCIHSCTRHRLCWYPDGKHGPIGAQRPLTQVSWHVRAYWRAGATASPPLTSSAYSLARLRADMTISLHMGTRNLRCLHLSVSKYSIAQNNSWALHCFMAQFDHSSCGRESLLHAPKLVLWAGFSFTCHMLLLGETFLLHVPC